MDKTTKKNRNFSTIFEYIFQKPYSMSGLIRKSSVVLFLAFLLTYAVILGSIASSLLNTTYSNVTSSVSVCENDLQTAAHNAEAALITYTGSNSDVINYSVLGDDLSDSGAKSHISTLLSTTLPYLSNIDGIFIYTKLTDAFFSKGTRTTDAIYDYLKNSVRQHIAEGESVDDPIRNWQFVRVKEEYYMLRIIRTEYCYVGCWIRLSTMTDIFDSLSEYNALCFYTDADGNPIGSDTGLSDDVTIDPSAAENGPAQVRVDGHRYLQVSLPSGFGDYYAVVLVPYSSLMAGLLPSIKFLLVLLAVILLLLLAILYFVNYMSSQPILALDSASKTILLKDSADHRMIDSKCIEVQDVTDAINELIGQIEDLQKSIYEEKMAKTDFELQYLKSQMAPHFLINCFSAITSMQATGVDPAITNRMIQTISDHLRYTLRPQNRVALSEELHYVENYLELTGIRYPGFLTYSVDCPEELENTQVFPLMILMLTENTIKYNMTMGELLNVTVTCKKEGPLVHITHIDSGDGFAEDVLPVLNDLIHMEGNPSIDGHRVGLYNIVKRLSLIYGEHSKIVFSNQEGAGARIDISIPYQEFAQEEV